MNADDFIDSLDFTDDICGCECDCTLPLNSIEAQKGICTYCINGSHQYEDWDD